MIWTRGRRRLLVWHAGFAALAVLATLGGLATIPQGGSIALAWPASAVYLVWVLIGLRTKTLAVGVLGIVAVASPTYYIYSGSLVVTVGFVISLAAHAWVGAWVFDRGLRRHRADPLANALGRLPRSSGSGRARFGIRLSDAGDLGWLVLADVIAAAVSALPLILLGFAVASLDQVLLLGAAVAVRSLSGVVVYAPLLLVLVGGNRVDGPPSRRRVAELTVAGVALAGVLALVFLPAESLPLAFLVLPVASWFALRSSVRGATIEVFAIASVISVATLLERGVFHLSNVTLGAMLAQLFIGVMAVFVMLIALVRHERDRLTRGLTASEVLFRLGFESSPVGMALVVHPWRDHDGRTAVVRRVNRAFGDIVGRTPVDAAGAHLVDLAHPDDAEQLSQLVASVEDSPDGQAHGELRFGARDPERWGAISVAAVRADDDEPYAVVLVEDVTARRQVEALLEQQALHDGLTGLPNRILLRDRLDYAIAAAARGSGEVGLMFIDLDGFKAVNDSAGHAAGDELLKAVGERFGEVIRPGDTLARLGGDEFAVVCPNVEPEELQSIATRLLAALDEPIRLDSGSFAVGASIGLRLSDEGVDGEGMLHDADQAMYAAKRAGRGRSVLHDVELSARSERMARLLPELQEAIDNDEFELHGEPLVVAGDGRIAGVEMLLRWRHPRRGLLRPGEFLDVAESSPLIRPIGRFALREGLRVAATWPEPAPDVHINIAGRQLETGSLSRDVREALAESGVPATRLVLEITESSLPLIRDSLRRDLEALRAEGVRIAIDDLGTGYSSLHRLTELPVDILKIDHAFTAALLTDRGSEAIVRAIATMGDALGVTVVAEGVESAAQAERMTEIGVQLLQGYCYGRTLEPGPLADLLLEGRADPHA